MHKRGERMHKLGTDNIKPGGNIANQVNDTIFNQLDSPASGSDVSA
jgi:hypothetical protein